MERKEGEVNIQDFVDILFRYRRLVITAIVASLIVTLLRLKTVEKVYQASAVLRASLVRTNISILPEATFSNRYLAYNPLQSEMEVLSSTSLQSRAYMRLGYNLDFGKLVGLSVDSAYSYYPCEFGEYSVEIYSDSTLILKNKSGRIIDRGKIGDIIRGKGFHFKLVSNSGSIQPQKVTLRVEEPIGKKLDVDIKQRGSTDLVTIIARGRTPKEAAKMANYLAQEYIQYTLSDLREEAKSTRLFIEEQIASLNKDLQFAEQELQQFKKQEGIYELSSAVASITNQLSTLESEKARALTEKTEAEMLYQKYKDELAGKGFYQEYKLLAANPEVTTNPFVTDLRSKISSLEIKKAELLSVFGAQHPQVLAIDKALAQTKEELRKVIQSMVTQGPSGADPVLQRIIEGIVDAEVKIYSLNGKINALDELITKYQARLQTMPEKEVQLAELQRKVDVARNVYAMLLDKLQEAKIAEAGKVSDAKIIDPAFPPKRPIRPKPKRDIFVGLVLGIILGIGLAFAFEFLDDTVKTPEEVEKVVNTPVLGVIPLIEGNTKERAQPAEVIKNRLVTHYDPKSPIAESFRNLRANIKFAGLGTPPKSVVVSSSIAGEGKTTIASNLAISFAQLGNSVVLVDADLRNPMINKVFGLSREEPGLSDIITRRVELVDAMYDIEDIPNLHVITCGFIPPNPTELLGSTFMENLIQRLTSQYDIVIFDSPPILPAADAVELGKKTNGVLIVVQAGVSERSYLREVTRTLENTNTKLIGTVLNAVDVMRHYGYYRYRYYRYYRYYSYGEKVEDRRIIDIVLDGLKKFQKGITRIFGG